MTRTRVSILLASSALLIASGASAQQRMKGSGIVVAKDEVMPWLNEKQITAFMAAGDSLEIEIGRLAHEKGSDQRIREFGLMLANDHTTHLAKTWEIITDKQVGIEPIPDDVMAKDLREQLSWLQENPAGAGWDATFLRFQAQHHQRAMNVLRLHTPNAGNDDLEDHLKKTQTSLAKHRDMAKSIATTLGVSLP